MHPIVKQPSACLPMIMSFVALAIVLGRVAAYGVVREADEGAAAHLWQLLMVGQVPLAVFFTVKWLPRTPRQALQVLTLQVCAALAALAPVFLYKL